jgi:molecular chaperone GrpE
VTSEAEGGGPRTAPEATEDDRILISVDPEDEDADAAPGDESAAEPAPAEGEATGTERELEEMRERWLRARADLENYRRRTERARERMRHDALAALMRSLLPVLDDLDRALSSEAEEGGLREGVEIIARGLRDALAREGLEPIPADGEVFDPEIHEAGATEITDRAPAQTVLAELRRGYRLGSDVLRPTLVQVAMAPEEDEPS